LAPVQATSRSLTKIPTVLNRKSEIKNNEAATKGELTGRNWTNLVANPVNPLAVSGESPNIVENRGKKAATLKPSNSETAKVTTKMMA
tara:strand:- start:200 stop:463 length:264 start_codon:yes stop_codon:yes gene_type:complete